MSRPSLALLLAGASAVLLIGLADTQGPGAAMIARLQAAARASLDHDGAQSISVRFTDDHGWPTRHPTLAGGERLDDATRAQAAADVAALPGVGGVRWAPRASGHQSAASTSAAALGCQHSVEGILRTRSIRFTEGSAAIDPASGELLNEVATALRPCVGSIIAITGHTNAQGDEAINLALSAERAVAVRDALASRGIDMAGLRAKGVGSERGVSGLDPADPANRRIEFSVLAPASLEPTPVDTPGAG